MFNFYILQLVFVTVTSQQSPKLPYHCTALDLRNHISKIPKIVLYIEKKVFLSIQVRDIRKITEEPSSSRNEIKREEAIVKMAPCFVCLFL